MVKNLAVEGIVPLVADRRGVSAVPNANARNMMFRVATAFRQQPSRSRVVKSQRVTMNEQERWPSTMSAYLVQRSNTLRLTCFSLRQPKIYCRDSGVTGVVAGGFDAAGRASWRPIVRMQDGPASAQRRLRRRRWFVGANF
jgi:hypothetical protein